MGPWFRVWCFLPVQRRSRYRETMGLWLVALAGVLWGVTNPYLKKFTAGFNEVSKGSDHDAVPDQQTDSTSKGIFASVVKDLTFLLKRPKYLAVQGFNFVGSVVFAVGMSTASLSVGPALANGLSMALTCLISTLVLKEEPMSTRTALGVLLIFSGMLVAVSA